MFSIDPAENNRNNFSFGVAGESDDGEFHEVTERSKEPHASFESSLVPQSSSAELVVEFQALLSVDPLLIDGAAAAGTTGA